MPNALVVSFTLHEAHPPRAQRWVGLRRDAMMMSSPQRSTSAQTMHSAPADASQAQLGATFVGAGHKCGGPHRSNCASRICKQAAGDRRLLDHAGAGARRPAS